MVRIVAGMEGELRLGYGEDQPSASRIDVGKSQLVTDEAPGLLRLWREENAVAYP